MALTHSTAARNAAADSVVDLLDVGGVGSLVIGNAAMAQVLATLPLGNPAFGDAAAGVATANAIADGTVSNSDTAAAFELRNNAGTKVIGGTVTATGGGGDITFDSVIFTAGQTIQISSLTYQGESQ